MDLDMSRSGSVGAASLNSSLESVAEHLLNQQEYDAFVSLEEELKGLSGIVYLDDFSKSRGIIASVLVSALRKLENAGVLETKLSGMKGTYIHFFE